MVSCRGSGHSRGDEYGEGDIVGGPRGRSTRRRSTPSGLGGELAKFKITGGNCDEEGKGCESSQHFRTETLGQGTESPTARFYPLRYPRLRSLREFQSRSMLLQSFPHPPQTPLYF
jgi:hypothetical protein